VVCDCRVVYAVCDCRVVYAIVIVDPFMWFVIVSVYGVFDCSYLCGLWM
jgi:hypothetical protein